MDNIYFLDKTADGKYIAGRKNSGTFTITDFMTAEEIFKTENIKPEGAALSPDKNVVAVACNDWTVKVYDLKLNKQTLTLEGHYTALNSVTFTPSGKHIISSASDNQTIVWDAATGTKLLTLVAFNKLGEYEGQAKDFLVVAPNGRYDGTEAAINQFLYFEKAGKHISATEYKEKCYTPNLLGKTLGQEFIVVEENKTQE